MYSFTQSVTCRNYQTNEANYPEILGAIQLRFLLKNKIILTKAKFHKSVHSYVLHLSCN